MHKWLMEKGKCLKMEMENKGIDNLTKEDLEEAYYYSKVLKNLMCLEKDEKIVEAMEKSENEANMDMIELFEDYPEKKYYKGQPRSKTSGRFMSRNDGRRNYDEPQDYQMDMAMHRMASEDMRDLDHRKGVHYYTDGGVNVSENMTPQSREMFMGNNSSGGSTRLDRARKMYEEKQDAKSFEEYLEAMKEELMKHKSTMDETQKNMAKQKLVNMTNSL